MSKQKAKKSTILTLKITTAVLLSLIVVLTAVGVIFALRKKDPATPPETVVNPLDFATDTWDGETEDNSSFLSGDKLGNRGDNVYTINSASSFAYFVNLVNDEDRAKEYDCFRGYTIYLNSNIDLAGYSIQSIGKRITVGDETTSTFQGTFNGAYYSIMNANIVGNGLFGYVENATIQNVGLYNATITSQETYTGSIVGEAVNTNISNVYARLGSTQGSTVGGLVGSFVSNNGAHSITNSFADNTLIGDRVGALVGYLSTNHDSQNAVTISSAYYTQDMDAIHSLFYEGTLEENFVTLTDVINTNVSTDFSSWNYTSEYSPNVDWCDYAYRENSLELSFNFPLQSGFVKVFLNGSYIENTVTVGNTTTDSSSLAESFDLVDANETAEVHIIVEKVFVEDEAVAKENATLTLTPDVDTTLVRSDANNENIIVGSSNSKLYVGEQTAQVNTPTLTIDGNIDYVKSNNLQSGSLIYAQGEDLIVGSNVVLQNNINNTTGFGGAVSVYNINKNYDPVANTAETIDINASVDNCEATYGGAFCIINSTVDFTGGSVTNCYAEMGGGGLAIIDPTTIDSSENQQLVSTFLKYGGNPAQTIARQTITTSTTLTNQTYENLSTSSNGGALYVNTTGTVALNLSGTVINNCSANAGGGGVYYQSSSYSKSKRLSIYNNSEIYNCSTTSLAGAGGGVYTDRCYFQLYGDSTIHNNTADSGGGLFLSSTNAYIGTSTSRSHNISVYDNVADSTVDYLDASDNIDFQAQYRTSYLYCYDSVGFISGSDYVSVNDGILIQATIQSNYRASLTTYFNTLDMGYITASQYSTTPGGTPSWTSGSKSYSVTATSTSSGRENPEPYYPLVEYNPITVTFDANGGEFDNGSETTTKEVLYGDTYGGMNLYDPTLTTDRTAGLSIYSTSTTSSYYNAFNITRNSTSSTQWFNFNTPFGSDTEYESHFIPNSTYTIVVEVLYYSNTAVSSGIYICTPTDMGDGTQADSDIATSQTGVVVNRKGVYTTQFTTKSDLSGYNNVFRSYANIPTGRAITMRFRISIFFGDVDIDTDSFDYAGYGETPNSATLPTPTKTGSEFDSWYYAGATSGYQVTTTTEVTEFENHTLLAAWNPIPYTVTFNANGGSVSTPSKIVYYGNTYSTLPTPTRSGYTFDGWYTSATGGTRVTSSTTVTTASNHTLYAHWTAVPVTVTKSVNGSSTSASVSQNSIYDPGEVSNIASSVVFNGWDSTTDIDIYTDLIYQYYGGENLGALPTNTYTSSAISLTPGMSSSSFTYIVSMNLTYSRYGQTFGRMTNSSGSTTKWQFQIYSSAIQVSMNGSTVASATPSSSLTGTHEVVLAFTYNSSTREVCIYMNGELLSSTTISQSYSYSSSDVFELASSSSPNSITVYNAFIIPGVVDVSALGSTYAAKDTTGNFLALVGDDGTITANYAVDIPTATTSFVYNGRTRVALADGTGYTRGGTYQATNAGTYTATASLDEDYYSWEDGTTANKSFSWTISRAEIDIPSANTGLVYNGSTQTGIPSDSTHYSRRGTYQATDAGNYTATVTPTSNYRWSDGTTSAKSINWTIDPYGLSVGTYSVTYTGASSYFRAVDGASDERVTFAYYPARPYSAGSYTYTSASSASSGYYRIIIASSNAYNRDNYEIASAGTFTINPATIVYESEGYSGTYDGTTRRISVTVTTPSSGYTITYSRSANGTYSTTNPGYSNAVVRTIYFRITAPNYNTVNGSEVISISRRAISIPSAITGLVYNGQTQTGVSAGTGYTVTGNTAMNAGDYTATVVPISNYCWTDGAITTESISWSIDPYGLSAGNYSVTYTGASTYSRSYFTNVNSETITLTYRPASPYSARSYTYTSASSASTGYYRITLSDDNYEIASAGTFTINSATISYSASGYTGTYDGSSHSITVSVTSPTSASITYSTTSSGTYTSSKPSYTNAGTYTIYFRITASNYTTISGSRQVIINRASISQPSAVTGLVYNGTEQTGVASGTGYTRGGTYEATDAGTYSATVTPTSNYQWSSGDNVTSARTISWSIAKREVSECDITLSQTSYTFDGSAKQPTVTVRIGSFTVPSSNYTVGYSNNTNVGTATVTVTATSSGNLTGSDTTNFTISTTSYTITYNTNGGNAISSTTYSVATSSQTVTLTIPIRVGYAFTGYTITTQTSGSSSSVSGTTLTIPANAYGNITIRADWSIETFSVSYNTNGGAWTEGSGSPTSYTYNASQAVTLPGASDIARAGYTFTNWTLGFTFTTDDWTEGFINVNTGAFGPSSQYPNSIYSTPIYVTAGVTYTISGGSSSVRWRAFDLEGNYINNVSDSSTYTPSQDCMIYILFYNGATTAQQQCTITTNTTVTSLPEGFMGNVRLTANWSAKTYSVSYNTNGGSWASGYSAPTSYTFSTSQAVTLPSASNITRAGYAFNNWTMAFTFTADDWTEGFINMSTGAFGPSTQYPDSIYSTPIYVTAGVTYTLSGGNSNVRWRAFDLEGNYITNVSSSSTYTPNEDCVIYIVFFYGATTAEQECTITANTRVTSLPANFMGNISLTANWSGNTYTISYNENGGVAIDNDSYTVSSSSQNITLDTTTRAGYTFSHYTISVGTSNGTSSISGTTLTIPANAYGNITVTANWSGNRYTITYDTNGGNTISSETYIVRDSVRTITLETPTRTGYNFSGYTITTQTSNGNSSISDNVTLTIPANAYGNITVQATWDIVDMTVTFNANGGSVTTANKEVTYGQTYGTLPTPTRSGYVFDGWFTNTNYTTEVTSSTTVTATSDHTLYARWYVNLPSAVTGLVYNGNVQTGVPTGTGYEITGNTATNAGSYTATLSLASPSNSFWADGTTEDKEINWSIARAGITQPSAITGLVYDGTTQTGVPAGTGYNITGNTGVDAGTYSATVTPTSNYCWSSGNNVTSARTISWSIAKYGLNVSAYSVTWTGANTYSRTNYSTGVNNETVTLTYTPYSSNAGTYEFATSASSGHFLLSVNDDNYTISDADTFTIGSSTIRYSAPNVTVTYDGNGHHITVTVTTPSSGATVTYATTEGGPYISTNPSYTDADTYTIYFRITANNYETVEDSATLTINRLSIAQPSAVTGLVYNGSDQTGVPAGTGYTRGGTYHATDAGTYQATVTPDSNHQWNSGSNVTGARTISWSIAKYALDVSAYSTTWTGASTYSRTNYSTGVGGDTVTLTYTPYSTNADTYSYATSASAGHFTLSVNDTNYTIDTAGDFTINSATIVYTANSYAVTYDGAGHSLTVTVTTPSSGATITYSTDGNSYTSSNPSFTEADVHTVYFRITANNYTTVESSRTITINRASVSAPSAETDLVYNGQTQTGVFDGDGYTVTDNTGVDADDYTATATLDNNHIWNDGTTDPKEIPWSIAPYGLDVSAYSATWTGASTYSRTNYSTGVNNEIVTLTYTPYSTNVGTYTYSATAGSGHFTLSVNDTNYTIETAGNFIIGSAIISYTASNVTETYTGEEYSITVSVTTPSSGATITYSTDDDSYTSTNPSFTEAGTYTVYFRIAAEGYTTVEDSRIVQINRASIDVPTAVSGLEYTGLTQTGVVDLENDGYTLTDNTGINAGNYTAIATLDSNHQWSDDGSTDPKEIPWSIAKADLTITAEDKSMVYGSSEPAYSYSGSGFVNGETESVLGGTASYTITSGSTPITNVSEANAGTYTISVTGLTSNNYNIEYATGELTITARSLSDCDIQLSQEEYTFDGTEKTPTVTVKIGDLTVNPSQYTVDYDNNIYVGTQAEVIVTANGNNLSGSVTVYFEIVTTSYTISYDTANGNTIPDTSYEVSATEQQVQLTAPTRDGYSFTGYEITKNTINGEATISNNTTLTIPANAYGDIEVTATWSVTLTIEIDGQKAENELSIVVGESTFTEEGSFPVAENSNITISTTLTADADASDYQLFSIYINGDFVSTTSPLLAGSIETNFSTTLRNPITSAMTLTLEYKDGKQLVVDSQEEDLGVTTEIEINGTSDGNVYATDSETITVTVNTAAIESSNDTYIGFTYVINGETHSSYSGGDDIVNGVSSGNNEYVYSISGSSEVTNIELIIRQARTVTFDTDAIAYNSLSLTSVDGFTAQLDPSQTTYTLYDGDWEINVDPGASDITAILDAVFGESAYYQQNDSYYYTVSASSV